MTTMTENIQIMTVDIALDYPDYTADGLMDIRVEPRCKREPMTYATRCKYLTKIGSICRLTRQMPVVVCMGICENYEPVDSSGGRDDGI